MADLGAGELTLTGAGCWTSMAPDNSYRMWIFDGAHKNVALKSRDGGQSRQVALHTAPGVDGYEVYHPRWSNHVRFIALTGPYKIMGRYNAIRGGGQGINIFAGRFNVAMDIIDGWAQVTDSAKADFFPDLWVEGGAAAQSAAVAGEPAGAALAPAPASRLRVRGRLAERTATPTLDDIRPYRSCLVEYVYDVLEVVSGRCGEEQVIVQHWAIVDDATVLDNRRIGDPFDLELERVVDHPELDGERVSSTVTDLTLDAYLDVRLGASPCGVRE